MPPHHQLNQYVQLTCQEPNRSSLNHYVLWHLHPDIHLLIEQSEFLRKDFRQQNHKPLEPTLLQTPALSAGIIILLCDSLPTAPQYVSGYAELLDDLP